MTTTTTMVVKKINALHPQLSERLRGNVVETLEKRRVRFKCEIINYSYNITLYESWYMMKKTLI